MGYWKNLPNEQLLEQTFITRPKRARLDADSQDLPPHSTKPNKSPHKSSPASLHHEALFNILTGVFVERAVAASLPDREELISEARALQKALENEGVICGPYLVGLRKGE